MTTISNNSLDVATSSASVTASEAAATTLTNVNLPGTCTFSTATTTINANSTASCLSSAQQEEYLQQQQQYQQLQQQQKLQQNHQKYNYYYPPPAVGNSSLLYAAANHNNNNNEVVVGAGGGVGGEAAATSASSAPTAATSTEMPTITTTATTVTGLATFNGNSNLENGAANDNDNNKNSFHLNYNNGNACNSKTTTNAFAGSSSGKINQSPSPVVAPLVVASNSIIGLKTDTVSYNSIVGTTSTSAFKKQQQQQQQQQQLHASREDVASLGGSSSINSQISTNNNHHNAPPTTANAVAGNGNGTSSSSNPHLSGILKGSKENLLQNNHCNGSIGGSTSGSEGVCSVPFNLSEHDDPGDGLGPLPAKWETAYTERGELYFIDHNTGTSHWLDPRLSKYQKKSLEECGEDELPYGWEKIEDSLYGTYYIDHVNRKTQYENPVLEAKRRAAEQKQQLQQQHQQQQQQQHHQHHQHHQHQLPPQRPQTPSTSSVQNGTNTSIALGSISSASTLSTVDISQRAMQPTPAMAQEPNAKKPPLLPYKFTRNPAEMQGERITTTLQKSARGLGITIVGGDDGVEEFLQIKSIVPNGPAWLDGQLQMGDVLVYVNDTCVLGFTHHEMVNVFQSIMPGETVTLEVCRGYSLPFDPNDPNTEVVTTIAVDGISAHEPDKQRRILMDLNMDGNYNFLDISGASNSGSNNKHNLGGGSAVDNSGFILMKKPEVHTFSIIKGAMGFGFTIADSSYGQKVKKILDRACCHQLQEGDILLEINEVVVRNKSHVDVVQILKDCSKTEPTLLKIQRPVTSTSTLNGSSSNSTQQQQPTAGSNTVAKLRKNFLGATTGGLGNNALFRSKTPTADLYSTMQKEILPIRPKTPLVDTRRARVNTPNIELNEDREVAAVNNSAEEIALERTLADSKTQLNNKSQNSLSEIDAINNDIPFMDPYPKMVTSLSERLAGVSMPSDALHSNGGLGPAVSGYLRTTASGVPNYENQGDYVSASSGNYSSIYGLAQMPPVMSPLSGGLYGPPATSAATTANHMPPAGISYHHHHESCFCYECQDYRSNRLRNSTVPHNLQPGTHQQQQQQQQPSPRSYYPVYHPTQHGHSQYSPASSASLQAAHIQNERMQKRVNELLNDRRRVGFPPLDYQHHNQIQINTGANGSGGGYSPSQQQYLLQHQGHGVINQQQQQHSPAQQQQLGSWPNSSAANFNTLQPALGHMRNGYPESGDILESSGEQYVLSEVTLQRQALGFGFRIVGGTEEGSQVTVGHIVPGGAADNDHRITTGDEILSIDGINVVNSSHHKVVSLMGEAALRGQVTMILRRRMRSGISAQPAMQQHTLNPQLMTQQSMLNNAPVNMLQHPASLQPMLLNSTVRYPYDVIVTRYENEGFGFVIISSSNQYYGSTIGKLIPGSPADRCGELKVGDRIIAVNRIDIAGMPHGDVVNLIKESGLHVRLTIGCPKEGAIINAAPTMPAGSGINAVSGVGAAAGSSTSGLLLNSAQASPSQLSQTLTPTLQTNMDASNQYFERPLLSGGSNAGSATSSSSQHQQTAQQSPNPLPAPPQL